MAYRYGSYYLAAKPDGQDHHAEGHEEPGENHQPQQAADPGREVVGPLVGLRTTRIITLQQGLAGGTGNIL
jgi:hypothetical protein